MSTPNRQPDAVSSAHLPEIAWLFDHEGGRIMMSRDAADAYALSPNADVSPADYLAALAGDDIPTPATGMPGFRLTVLTPGELHIGGAAMLGTQMSDLQRAAYVVRPRVVDTVITVGVDREAGAEFQEAYFAHIFGDYWNDEQQERLQGPMGFQAIAARMITMATTGLAIRGITDYCSKNRRTATPDAIKAHAQAITHTVAQLLIPDMPKAS